MTWTVCHLESDAAGVRIARSGGVVAWRADPPAEGESALEAARRRLADSAQWVAQQRPAGGRIDVVVLSVDDASCAWITAPSVQPQVVAAAVRQRDEDWGGARAIASVQPLAEHSTEKKPTVHLLPAWLKRPAKPASRPGAQSPGRRFAVLRMRDGAERLWIDAIDQAGVRVGAVISLWHALARSWADGPGLVATVALEPEGKLLWAWSDAGQLLAGGVVARSAPDLAPGAVADSDSADPLALAAGRLTLDWLTWSAQLGRKPERVVVVGEGADAFAERLRTVWPAAPVTAIAEPDPIGATLTRLGAARPQPSEPREALLDLSARPGRAHRTLYRWSAAAIGLLAVAVAAFGWRLSAWASDVRDAALTRRTELQTALAEVSPAAAQSELPSMVLQSQLAELEKANPRVVEPPPPRPVLDELVRVAQQIKAAEGSGVEVDRVKIGVSGVVNSGPEVSMRAKDIATAERIRAQITSTSGQINWTGRFDGVPPNVNLRLLGEWKPAEVAR